MYYNFGILLTKEVNQTIFLPTKANLEQNSKKINIRKFIIYIVLWHITQAKDFRSSIFQQVHIQREVICWKRFLKIMQTVTFCFKFFDRLEAFTEICRFSGVVSQFACSVSRLVYWEGIKVGISRLCLAELQISSLSEAACVLTLVTLLSSQSFLLKD